MNLDDSHYALDAGGRQGQMIVVLARWLLIGVGLALTFWGHQEPPLDRLRFTFFVLLALAGVNFYLYSRLLADEPVEPGTVYLTAAGDLAVITMLVAATGGQDSRMLAYYFPSLAAFALVFPRAVTVAFTLTVSGAHLLAAVFFTPSGPLDVAVIAVNLTSLVGLAAVAATYRKVEAQRRSALEQGDLAAGDVEQDDLFHGQFATVCARWFVVAVAAGVGVWSGTSAEEVSSATALVVMLMGINFALHARCVTRRPPNLALATLFAGLDIVVILFLVGGWSNLGVGLANPFYVLFYPVLLAMALVFPPRLTLTLVGTTLAGFVAITLVSGDLGSQEAIKTLVGRVATMAAAAGLGAWYWRCQRQEFLGSDTDVPRAVEEAAA